MRKFFITLMLLLFMSATVSALGRLANSDEILAEMYANPSNFIRYGGASIGMSFLIVKNSLNVELYAPPNYIISARKITHFNSGMNDKYEAIEDDSVIRYKYDYATRKMYMERQDKNKNLRTSVHKRLSKV